MPWTSDAEYQRELARMQRKYHCHIRGCTTLTEPTEGEYYADYTYDPIEEPPEKDMSGYEYLWDTPKNLWECSNCGKWTCEIHLDQNTGYCEKCQKRRR